MGAVQARRRQRGIGFAEENGKPGEIRLDLREYNGYGQLCRVSRDAEECRYTYRPDGLRHEKVSGNPNKRQMVSTLHHWDGQNMVLETDGAAGTAKRRYLRGVNPVAQVMVGPSPAFFWYMMNAHGDVVQRMATNGTVAHRYEYDAFGNQRGEANAGTQTTDGVDTDPNPFRYCGEYWDGDLQEIYLRARSYDPRTGRFTQEDAVAGTSTDLPNGQKAIDPFSLNRYAYAKNNPIIYVDSSGNIAILTALAIIGLGAFIGGAINLGGQLISNGGNFEDVNWRSFVAATVAGGVTAGLTMVPGGASLGLGATMTWGGFTSATGYATYNFVNGTQITPEGMLYAAAGGALSAGFVHQASLMKSPPPSLSSKSSVWSIDPKLRGRAIESRAGGMNNNFPTIDKFTEGKNDIAASVTSIKSMDLTAKTYGKGNAVYNKVMKYVKELAGFKGADWNNITVNVDEQTQKILELYIPDIVTDSQWQQLLDAIAQAQQMGIYIDTHFLPYF